MMITNLEELHSCLSADALHYEKRTSGRLKRIRNSLGVDPISNQKNIWNYIKTLRYVEFYTNRHKTWEIPLLIYYRCKLNRLAYKTGFQIPPNVVGVICQMTGSASSAIYAQGNIKWYAIYKSLMNLLPVIIAYVSFAFGCAPYWLYVPMVVVWGIGGDIVIVRYAQKLCGISILLFVKRVLAPVLGASLMMLLMGWSSKFFVEECYLRLISCCLLTTVGLLVSLLTFGMSNDERLRVMKMLRR